MRFSQQVKIRLALIYNDASHFFSVSAHRCILNVELLLEPNTFPLRQTDSSASGAGAQLDCWRSQQWVVILRSSNEELTSVVPVANKATLLPATVSLSLCVCLDILRSSPSIVALIELYRWRHIPPAWMDWFFVDVAIDIFWPQIQGQWGLSGTIFLAWTKVVSSEGAPALCCPTLPTDGLPPEYKICSSSKTLTLALRKQNPVFMHYCPR